MRLALMEECSGIFRTGDKRSCFFSRMLRLSVALTGLLFLTSACAHDTEGTSFHVVFFRNQLNSSVNFVDIVNNGAVNVNATISYYKWENGALSNSPKTESVTVPAGQRQKYPFYPHTNNIVDYVIGPGFNIYPDLRVRISTSGPVSVYATNTAEVTLAGVRSHTVGDTYMVLPDSMAGREYVINLPDALQTYNPQDLWQMKVLFFIPIRTSVRITFSQKTATGWSQDTKFTLNPIAREDQRYFAQITGLGDSFFKITGDGDFLVLAGVTCAPDHQGDCDFAAYMPPPIVDQGCGSCLVTDDHLTYSSGNMFTSDQYVLAAPTSCHLSVPYVVKTDIGEGSPQSLDPNNYNAPSGIPVSGKYLLYSTNQALLQMSRIGNRTKENGGLYLDLVPSISQFITGQSTFYSPAKNTVVKIFMDTQASNDLTIGGQKPNGDVGSIGIYKVLSTTVNSGIYQVVSKGRYLIEVQTTTDSYTRGFIVAYNKQSSDTPSTCTTFTPPTTTPITTMSTPSTPSPPTPSNTPKPPSTPSSPAPPSTTRNLLGSPSPPTTAPPTATNPPTTPNISSSTATTPPSGPGKDNKFASQQFSASIVALVAALLFFVNL
ncbi:hypothetical protein L596_014146 [Steinernema carpocapsae]|uniref:IgGFc-binding protein N-terminal domain-containing protein n=1 Tax=Steinernema carpocapsae TaxID=34508 RepID=A0A4U5NAW7_STECR|nr:hypothetical protein L596_014146 [Steinernema carpocapsae]